MELNSGNRHITSTSVKWFIQSWWCFTFWKGCYLLLSCSAEIKLRIFMRHMFLSPLGRTKAQICPEGEHPPLRCTPWKKLKWWGFASSFPAHLPPHKTCTQKHNITYGFQTWAAGLHTNGRILQLLGTKAYLLKALHHEMSRISRVALSQERSFCRLWWKLHSISSSAALNSGPRQPLKMGIALCWPSSQRANWCWQSQTWWKRRPKLSNNNPIMWNITDCSIWLLHGRVHSCVEVKTQVRCMS